MSGLKLHRSRLEFLSLRMIAVVQAKTVNLASLVGLMEGKAQADSFYRTQVRDLASRAQRFFQMTLEVSGIEDKRAPLFQAFDRSKKVSGNKLDVRDVQRMLKTRARAANLTDAISPHTFRATGITVYLKNGGTLEKAQQIARLCFCKT